MINAIAVDDEPVALDVLRLHARTMPELSMLGYFDSAQRALDFMRGHSVDLVFLDINMPGMNGLDFAKQIDPAIQLIFSTAYADYAIHGFELSITDFLLKPISLQRFQKACSLAQNRSEQKDYVASRQEVIFLKDGYDLVRISLSGLMYIKADDNYLSFVERDKYTLTRMTMAEAMQKLNPDIFARVHKSYIVNLDFITKLEFNKILMGKTEIPVSKALLPGLRSRLSGT
jgi:two-component system, LytTR family, response regulator